MSGRFLKHLEFETLKDSSLEIMQAKSASFMAELVENKRPHWLSLLGSSGTGKTHLCAKMYSYFKAYHRYYMGKPDGSYDVEISQRYNISYWKASGIAESLRSGDFSIMHPIRNDHFIVIDDLGGEMDSEFMSSKWFEILDSRLGKWTLINSNMTIDAIADKIDNRIASRLVRDRNTVIDCNTTDYGFRGVQG